VDDPDATWPTQSLLGKRSRDSDDDDEDGPRSGRHRTAATRSQINPWRFQELNRYLEKDWNYLWEEQSRTEEEAESERASLWSKVGAAGLSLCLVNEEAKRERKRRKTQEGGAQKPEHDPLFASNFHVPGHESSSPDASPSKCEHSLRSNDEYDVILQPETRPISQEELVAEVQGIYAGLVMVEAKCIEVDNRKAELEQAEVERSMLSDEQWQALIALHRTLLHEHHDFFLAAQHPSASPALRSLAQKYATPAQSWRHGIHSFLELLKHRQSGSLEHMESFTRWAEYMSQEINPTPEESMKEFPELFAQGGMLCSEDHSDTDSSGENALVDLETLDITPNHRSNTPQGKPEDQPPLSPEHIERVLRLVNSISKRIGGVPQFNLPEAQESDDRELWSGVASDWYSEPERTPMTGLYQHLAIISRPNGIQQQLDSKIPDNLSSTDLADPEVGKSSILVDQSEQSSDTDVWSSQETLGLAADPAEVFGNPTPVIAQGKQAAKDLAPPSAVMEQTFTGFSETVAGLDTAEWNLLEVDTEESPESTLQQHDFALEDESWHALKCPGAFPQSRDEIFLESQMSRSAATIPEPASNPPISDGLWHRTLHSCQELLRNSFSDTLKDLAQSVLPTSQLHLENMWQDYLESEVMMSWNSEETPDMVEVLDNSVSLSESNVVQQDSGALESSCLQQSVISCSSASTGRLAVSGPAFELIEKQDEALDGDDKYEDFHDCHEYTTLPWEIIDPKAPEAPSLADCIKPFELQSPDPNPQLKSKDHCASSPSEALEPDGTDTLRQTLSALELVPRQAYSEQRHMEQQTYLPGPSVPSLVSGHMKHSNGHSTTEFVPQFISPTTLMLSESDRYRQRRYEAQELGSFRRTRRSEGTGRRRYYSTHGEEEYNDDHDDSAYGYLDDFQRAHNAGRTSGRRYDRDDHDISAYDYLDDLRRARNAGGTSGRRYDRDDHFSLRPSGYQRTRRLGKPGLRSSNDDLSPISSLSLPRGDKQSLPTKRNPSTGLTVKNPGKSSTDNVKYKCTQPGCNHLFSTPARLQRHERACGNPTPATSVTGEDTGTKNSAVLKDTQFGTPKSSSLSPPPPPPPPASPTSSLLTQSSPSSTISITTHNPVGPHICSYCQKSFPKPYALRYILSHSLLLSLPNFLRDIVPGDCRY
jgi:hypothetical protein